MPGGLMRVIRAINFTRALIHCVIRIVTVLNCHGCLPRVLVCVQINSLLPISSIDEIVESEAISEGISSIEMFLLSV
jgi:predicted metal-binding protein